MKPTLLILAAGMGSRYGGLKQLEKVGPNGETLIDYSIYDAMKSGFGKVVFVIRKSFEKEFRDKIVSKYENIIPVKVVFQELDFLPEGMTLNPDRKAPWGTNHALLMAKKYINEPFGVINADDFYGRESFQLLAGQLRIMGDSKREYRMIGYLLGNTLTDSGVLARAICQVDGDNNLISIKERESIQRVDGVPSYKDENGEWITLTDTNLVSMNMWAFTPDYFDLSEKYFIQFLNEKKEDLNAEFKLPSFISTLVKKKEATIRVINTPSVWFGLNYADEKSEIIHRLKEQIGQGVYPHNLF